MQPSECMWVNGCHIPLEKAQISLLTHTLHYGDGSFEGINVYDTARGPAIFRLSEHVARLYDSFSIFNKEIPYSQQELATAIIELVRVNGLKEGYIRPLVYLGGSDMKLDIRSASVNVAIMSWNWGRHLGDDAVRAMISSVQRIHKRSLFVDKKIIGHYVNSILAHQEAKQRGYDEAILLDCHGEVTEGSAANLFVVRDQVLQTPQLGNIFPGITRDSVLRIAQKLGIPTQELIIFPSALHDATEAFFTGTATGISPIRSIDEHLFSYQTIGEITARIQSSFDDITHGRSNMFPKWLTYTQ